MPRILPRLIKLPLSGHLPFPRNRPQIQRKPVPPLPSSIPADYSRSVLLSPGNIITNSHDYVLRKSRPPVYKRRISRQKTEVDAQDTLREMTSQECIWWSSPYLRMLATPVRQCFLTQRYLPTDFMIRLTSMNVPPPLRRKGKFSKFIFSDGLLHPKFKMRKVGRGKYIICWREALALLYNSRWYHYFGAIPSPHLAEQIAHLLRLRVLQELLLIVKELKNLYRVRADPSLGPPLVVRRLTRAEWGMLKTTGVLPHPGALAVLVVPPVNRDPTTKQRPPTTGAMSPAPPVHPSPPQQPVRKIPPLCVLHPISAAQPTKFSCEASVSRSTTASEAPLRDANVNHHSREQIPLYNGVALFPGRIQRAKLHTLLTRILGVEAAWRFSDSARSQEAVHADHSQKADKGEQRKGDNKGSHAFLICGSNEVDVAPLGVALWRVRMWEGAHVVEDELDDQNVEQAREAA
ncbi:hypothetical protein GGX14DRAFT_509584 [Mycena pura]|uniref:Uncharacterized protein n=1 Tax=Mycena pura TaxID=153505 RepID=A0AAD6YTF3_9AGAR|nr:hypothetical protein GGX14DRAFT_509584 [Mycena pura]